MCWDKSKRFKSIFQKGWPNPFAADEHFIFSLQRILYDETIIAQIQNHAKRSKQKPLVYNKKRKRWQNQSFRYILHRYGKEIGTPTKNLHAHKCALTNKHTHTHSQNICFVCLFVCCVDLTAVDHKILKVNEWINEWQRDGYEEEKRTQQQQSYSTNSKPIYQCLC